MRKLFVVLSVLAMLSLVLSACGTQAPAGTVNSEATSVAATVQALVPATPTPNVIATSVAATVQALTPTAAVTETPSATLTPTNAPTLTNTPTAMPVALRMRTAEDVREFFSDIEGWVSGGDAGQWVAGAQGTLAEDLELKSMPEGMTFEFECVQYYNLGGKLYTKKVCDDAVIRFSEVIPEGSVGTVWLEWPVKGSANEKWEEGFVNKPCECADGDCRK